MVGSPFTIQAVRGMAMGKQNVKKVQTTKVWVAKTVTTKPVVVQASGPTKSIIGGR